MITELSDTNVEATVLLTLVASFFADKTGAWSPVCVLKDR
jgi:hypothetical protein